MPEKVYVDSDTCTLVRAIEAITDQAEFSMVCTALETALARRIKREQGANAHPAFSAIAGQMVARHVMALMDLQGLNDA